MSITRRGLEKRVWSGGGANWGPYADGTIPPNWWNGPGMIGSSGQTVNADSALRIATVWACIQLVADYIAMLPVTTATPKPDGEIVKAGQVPPLLAQPWPEITQYEWFFQMQASLMLRGNAYGRKMDFDSLGYPRMIQPIGAEQVKVTRENGQLTYKFGNKDVRRDEVFHLRAFTLPGKDTGLSPIENFAQTMGVNLAAEDFAAHWFGDGAHPTGVLESAEKIDKGQADTILNRLRAKFAGGNREPIILGAGTTWKQIQVAPNESQFLDTIRAGDIQIAKIFGLGAAPELVGSGISGSNITYANVEGRSLDLQTYGIMPWTTRWSQALTPLVPHAASFVQFDLDALLKVDSQARWNTHMMGMRAGVYCADDVRHKEGLAPLPNDDGKQFNWPPYNVKNEETAAEVTDPANDPALEPSPPAPTK